jgi:single-strand DNA-binding protein
MANYAQATILGHLCREWELRFTPNNNAVASNTIAVTHKYGERETKLFLQLTAWGKQAEVLNKHTTKGDPLFVLCRLETEDWTDKDGHKRSNIKGVVERFEFIDSKQSATGETRQAQHAVDDLEIPF